MELNTTDYTIIESSNTQPSYVIESSQTLLCNRIKSDPLMYEYDTKLQVLDLRLLILLSNYTFLLNR